jgi:hypothetical protein
MSTIEEKAKANLLAAQQAAQQAAADMSDDDALAALLGDAPATPATDVIESTAVVVESVEAESNILTDTAPAVQDNRPVAADDYEEEDLSLEEINSLAVEDPAFGAYPTIKIDKGLVVSIGGTAVPLGTAISFSLLEIHLTATLGIDAGNNAKLKTDLAKNKPDDMEEVYFSKAIDNGADKKGWSLQYPLAAFEDSRTGANFVDLKARLDAFATDVVPGLAVNVNKYFRVKCIINSIEGCTDLELHKKLVDSIVQLQVSSNGMNSLQAAYNQCLTPMGVKPISLEAINNGRIPRAEFTAKVGAPTPIKGSSGTYTPWLISVIDRKKVAIKTGQAYHDIR